MLGELDFSRMDRRVVIQLRAAPPDATGEPQESWSTSATVWAEVREPTGREVFQSDQRSAQIERVFVIRHRTLNQKDYRILYEGDVYDIEELVEIGRRAGLAVKCKVHRDVN